MSIRAKQRFVEVDLSKGFALGVSLDKTELQLAFIFFIISFNFTVVSSNVLKFIHCLKEN